MQVESVREAIDKAANSQGRSVSHIAAGVALTAGAVLASALVAGHNAPTAANPKVKAEYDRLHKPAFTPPRQAFAVIWPPLFLALTISGLRVWNAPPSRARTQALGLWGAVQGLNALWMALGPKRLGAQLAAAVASFGTQAPAVTSSTRPQRVGVSSLSGRRGRRRGRATRELHRAAVAFVAVLVR